MPSSSTPTAFWTAATAAPWSPYLTSAPDGSATAEPPRSGAVCVAAARGPPAAATAANGATTGPAAMDAVTATAALFHRMAYLRAASVISRRCTDRRSDRAHSSASTRSRLLGVHCGNDNS